MEAETVEQAQARHRKELKDLQGRITSKKKNATKKTRKGVNDECAELERQLREKQAAEIATLQGETAPDDNDAAPSEDDGKAGETTTTTTAAQDDTSKLAETTQNLSIADNAPPTAASEGQQAPGKKRNRQKERLARRAAEQEAEAIKAEEEAANMTDHRAIESEYMKKTFASHGLVEQQIAPDGHCLFSAVADQLAQNGSPVAGGYKEVRKAATEYMLANRDDFAPFLEEGIESYAAKMRDTAEWGGELELTALARRFRVVMNVVQDGRTERIGEGEKELWLAYYRHGYGLGEHYNSLRRK